MGNYTIVNECPECGCENIQVIDRYVDCDTGLTVVRHICLDCDNDWLEDDLGNFEDEQED